jgi:hypothetical protein
MIDYSYVRKLEFESKWEEALKFWKLYDYTEDKINVKAVELIIEANRKGDEFRRLMAPYREKLENHLINIYQYNEELNKAHKEVYGV